ncbi:MAG: hypothetical protein AB7Q29_19480 [Vicinamibacterales bacterium]
MRLIRTGTVVVVLIVGLWVPGVFAAGDDRATVQLARILLKFVHQCSTDQCRRLERLARPVRRLLDEEPGHTGSAPRGEVSGNGSVCATDIRAVVSNKGRSRWLQPSDV